MKNKIIGIIGILCILFGLGTFISYTNIKNNSELFGKEVIVLKNDIKEGKEITSSDIEYKKVKVNDLTTGYLTSEDINSLENKVANIDLHQNEQLTLDRLVDYDDYYPIGSEDVALDITAIGALAGNVKAGDTVNLWDRKTDSPDNKGSILVLENVKVIAVRDAQNRDVENVEEENTTPASIIVRLNGQKQVKQAKDIANLFVSKEI